MPVMQQAGIFQMDPDLGTPDRARAIVQPGTETGVVLSRISETTPPMPLEPSSVTGVYNHTIFAPGGGGVAHIEFATISRQGASNGNGRDPRPDEWTTVAPAVPATATHWRLVIDTKSVIPSPGDEWAVDMGNAFLEPGVALWHVNGTRLIGRGTYYGDLIGDEASLTFTIDPGSIYHILSSGMNWVTPGVAVRDRIFLTHPAWDDNVFKLNKGVFTIKEVVDLNNVIVYEPFEAATISDYNIVLVQKSNA